MSLTISTTYTVIDCFKCGALFAVPSQVNEDLLRTGRDFYCPNGHQQHYVESVQAKLEKEQQRRREAERQANARLELLHAEERSHAATRGVVTKQRKKLARVANGVCPCCNRSFQNLARHMETRHPDYAPH